MCTVSCQHADLWALFKLDMGSAEWPTTLKACPAGPLVLLCLHVPAGMPQRVLGCSSHAAVAQRLHACGVRAGMARFTCHDPHNIYDVIPCDLVASSILISAAALQQVRSTSTMLQRCRFLWGVSRRESRRVIDPSGRQLWSVRVC